MLYPGIDSKNFTNALLMVVTLHVFIMIQGAGEKRQTFSHGIKTSTLAIQLRQQPSVTKPIRPAGKTVKKISKQNKKKSPSKVVNQIVQEPAVEQSIAVRSDFESVIKNFVEPSYPRLALRRGITGEVLLALWIKGDGVIEKLLIERSSGNDSLDDSALTAAKSWKFKKISSDISQVYKFHKKVVYSIN